MNKKQKQQMNNHYQEQVKSGLINNLDGALAYKLGYEKAFSLHSFRDFFSFARYLNKNFVYFDNTDVGDIYKNNNGQGLYSEEDIYNNRLNNF